MMDDWFPLTYALTNLNRSLGLSDGYPFVLSTAAIDKLRFVHEAIAEQRGRSVDVPQPPAATLWATPPQGRAAR